MYQPSDFLSGLFLALLHLALLHLAESAKTPIRDSLICELADR
jgi:hypothetical protein